MLIQWKPLVITVNVISHLNWSVPFYHSVNGISFSLSQNHSIKWLPSFTTKLQHVILNSFKSKQWFFHRRRYLRGRVQLSGGSQGQGQDQGPDLRGPHHRRHRQDRRSFHQNWKAEKSHPVVILKTVLINLNFNQFRSIIN